MADYSDTPNGCYNFILPPDTQKAISDSVAFVSSGKAWDTKFEGEEWKYGLFCCHKNPMLALGVLCGCGVCVGYRSMERMSGKSCESVVLNMAVTNALCLGCCYYAHVRGEFRKKYGLKGSGFTDWATGCCFGPCATCSDANELMAREAFIAPYMNLPAGAAGEVNYTKAPKPVDAPAAK